jgi:hypothetical protein
LYKCIQEVIEEEVIEEEVIDECIEEVQQLLLLQLLLPQQLCLHHVKDMEQVPMFMENMEV